MQKCKMMNEKNCTFVLYRSLFLLQKQFHSENLFVNVVIKMLVMFSVESLVNFYVSIHILSAAPIIITTVNYKA